MAKDYSITSESHRRLRLVDASCIMKTNDSKIRNCVLSISLVNGLSPGKSKAVLFDNRIQMMWSLYPVNHTSIIPMY